MTGHAWLDQAAPYALDSLSPEERAAIEAHLAGCATCRAEVQTFRDVTGMLARAAPEATPAPALRDRVLREARRRRPIGRGRAPIGPWLAAAACLVLALASGYAYLRARGALQRTTAELAARDSLIATIFSPDVATAALAATGKPPSARLYWNPSRHRVVVAVFNLPPAPAGRTYQLWAIAQGKPVSLGVFNTAADGRLTAAMEVPPGLTFELTAVTEEPAGGSPAPTQQPFLTGKVAAD